MATANETIFDPLPSGHIPLPVEKLPNRGTCRHFQSPLCHGTDPYDSKASHTMTSSFHEDEMFFRTQAEAREKCPDGRHARDSLLNKWVCLGTIE